MAKHVLFLDAANTICCHTWETPAIQRDLRSTLEWWVQQPAGHSEAQVPQSGPSKSPVLRLIPLNLHFKLFHWTLLCTQHIGDVFTFLHKVCRPVYLFVFKIFLKKSWLTLAMWFLGVAITDPAIPITVLDVRISVLSLESIEMVVCSFTLSDLRLFF